MRLSAPAAGKGGTMQMREHVVATGAMPAEPIAVARKGSSRWRAVLRAALTTVAVLVVSCVAVALSLS